MDRILKRFALYLREMRKSRRVRKAGFALAGLVVFLTTYALILPAITIDRKEAGKEAGIVLEQTNSSSEVDFEEVDSKNEDSVTNKETETKSELSPAAQTESVVKETGEDEGIADSQEGETPTPVEEAKPAETVEAVAGEQTIRGADYTVRAAWDKDAGFPAGVKLRVSELEKDSQKYKEYLGKTTDTLKKEEALPEEYDVRLFDISFEAQETTDGGTAWKELEPSAKVNVEITYDVKETKEEMAAEEDAEVQVVHFAEAGAELVEAEATQEGEKARVNFEAAGFSIYAIVAATDTPPRITYKFEDKDGNPYKFRDHTGSMHSEQIIRNNDKLREVGIPIVSHGEVFKGWYTYDKENATFGADATRIEFDTPIPVTASKTVYVRPYYGEVLYLTFYEDSEGTKIMDRVQVNKEGGSATFDTAAEKAEPKDNIHKFVGWSEQKGNDDDSRVAINPSQVTVTADKSYYPVFKKAYWLEFVAGPGGSGVTAIDPVLLDDGAIAAGHMPTAPMWKGHTFEGWAETRDPDPLTSTSFTSFDENQPLTKDTKLYAQWTKGETNITVVFWQQSLTDHKTYPANKKTYEHTKQEVITVPTGSTVTRTSSEVAALLNTWDIRLLLQGFSFVQAKSDVSALAEADGSGVLNLYYDRKLMSIAFEGKETFTGLYGQQLTKYYPRGFFGQKRSGRYWSVGSSQISFLGAFVNPFYAGTTPERAADNMSLASVAKPSGSDLKDVYYQLQRVDGSYSGPEDDESSGTADDRGLLMSKPGSPFLITEKYPGFTVDKWREVLVPWMHWQTVTPNTSVPIKGRDAIYVRYKRLKYEISYLDSTDGLPLQGFDKKTNIPFEKPLGYDGYYPTGTPTSNIPGRTFNGRWYADRDCTTQIFFKGIGEDVLTLSEQNQLRYNMVDGIKVYSADGLKKDQYLVYDTMPARNLELYAGWTDERYWVKVDPNGGELPLSTNTYFWTKYGGDVSEDYKDTTRNFVEDSAGTYYYHYDEFNSDDPYGSQPPAKAAGYKLTFNGGTTYRHDPGAYKLLGWYKVENDGSLAPFSFTTKVTGDMTLRALWRRTGDYKVVYETQAVNKQGQPLMKDGIRVIAKEAPTDDEKYADDSNGEILRRPSEIPDGYVFRGWWWNGAAYNPEDAFTLDASKADKDKKIHLYPILIPVSDIELYATKITYDGNGGTTTLETDTATNLTVSTDKKTATRMALEINQTVTLPGAADFKRVGYTLKGWSDQAGDGNRRLFEPGASVGVDELNADPNVPSYTDDNKLYAVWEKKTYTVTVTKTVVGFEQDKQATFVFEPEFTPNLPIADQANFNLKNGEQKVFTVPYGTKVKIGEAAGNNFTVTVVATKVNDAEGNTVNEDLQGEPNKEYTVDGDITLAFTNSRSKQSIKVVKVDTADTSKELPGAVFDLYDDGDVKVMSGLTSNADGLLEKDNKTSFALDAALAGKTYYLKETTAPDGYNLAENRFKITVYPDKVLSNVENTVTNNVVTGPDREGNFTITVTNSAGIALPETGGPGTRYWTIGGLILVATAFIGAFYRVRSGERRFWR